MAAQQVDQAEALARLSQAAAGGSSSGIAIENAQSQQSVRTRSQNKSQPSVKVKKVTRPKRKAKRTRRDISPSEESFISRDIGNTSVENPPIAIPCRYGCGFSFNTVVEADTHVREAHAQPRVDQLAPSLGNLQNAPNPVSVSREISQLPPVSPLPIVPNQCDICKQFFASLGDLKSHKDRKHSQPALKCPISTCQFPLANELELVTHITMAHSHH